MIFLTGATGNVGSKVADLLIQTNTKFKASSRTLQNSNKSDLIDWCCVDFNDKESIKSAMQDVDTLILITPADKAMVAHQTNIIEVACEVGVKKVIKLSGLGAGPDAPIRLPKLHYQIEEVIKNTGLDYVFVRPNLFMQAIIYGSIDSIQSDGKVFSPVPNGKISSIDVLNIAEVIVKSTSDSNIKNTALEITGPEALSFNEIAKLFSKKMNRDIEYIAVSFEEAKQSMLQMGMDEWLVDAFIELYEIYENDMGSSVLDDNVKSLLGKAPTNFEDVLKEISFS